MGFVRIFRKNNVQEAYLQKKSILGQIIICLWDVSQLYTENSIQTLLIFWGSTQKNLEGFVWSFLSIAGLRYQRQFAPKCWFLASRPPGHCSFRISWQIPQISFLWRRTLVLYFQVNYLKYTRMDVQDCISTIRTHLKRSQQIIGIGIFLVPITHWLGFLFLEAKSGETQRNPDGWTVYLDETSERLSQREVKNKMDKEFSWSMHTSLGKCQTHCQDLFHFVQVLATKYKNKESNFESL